MSAALRRAVSLNAEHAGSLFRLARAWVASRERLPTALSVALEGIELAREDREKKPENRWQNHTRRWSRQPLYWDSSGRSARTPRSSVYLLRVVLSPFGVSC